MTIDLLHLPINMVKEVWKSISWFQQQKHQHKNEGIDLPSKYLNIILNRKDFNSEWEFKQLYVPCLS